MQILWNSWALLMRQTVMTFTTVRASSRGRLSNTQPILAAVMEFVDGGVVMDYDKDSHMFKSSWTAGVLPESAVRRVAFGLASALSHAHAKHVVHRDVKPDNVLISSTGKVKLADWGVAHDFESGALTGNLQDALAAVAQAAQEEDSDLAQAEVDAVKAAAEKMQASTSEALPSSTLRGTEGTFQFLSPEECSGMPPHSTAPHFAQHLLRSPGLQRLQGRRVEHGRHAVGAGHGGAALRRGRVQPHGSVRGHREGAAAAAARRHVAGHVRFPGAGVGQGPGCTAICGRGAGTYSSVPAVTQARNTVAIMRHALCRSTRGWHPPPTTRPPCPRGLQWRPPPSRASSLPRWRFCSWPRPRPPLAPWAPPPRGRAAARAARDTSATRPASPRRRWRRWWPLPPAVVPQGACRSPSAPPCKRVCGQKRSPRCCCGAGCSSGGEFARRGSGGTSFSVSRRRTSCSRRA